MKFSTKDQDNDIHATQSCSQLYKGGWWYTYCHKSNLNGLYLNGTTTSFADGVVWYHWKGYKHSLTFSEMKMRPGTNCYLHIVRSVKVYVAVELKIAMLSFLLVL